MRRRTEKGYILVPALVAIAGLLALMAVLAADEHSTLTQAEGTLCRARAQAAADAGLARAMSVISNANANLVQQTDDWYKLGNSGDDSFTFDDGSTFRLQIVDGGSLVNINTASQTQLTQLPLDQDQVDCLLDWRSAGSAARSDGAKDDYYNALATPYNTKLAALTTVDELLLVKNWTAQTIYQPPTITPTTDQYPTDENGAYLPLASLLTVDSGAPNTKADGTTRLNLNTRTVAVSGLTSLGLSGTIARRIITRLPERSFTQLFTTPGLSTNDMRILLNNVKFTSSTAMQTGEYNLNTVTQAVLATLPAVPSDVASSIVQQQPTGFTTLGALTAVSGISNTLLGRMADLFTVGSNIFIARIYGQDGGYGVAYEATIQYTSQKVQILKLNRLTTSGVPTWWAWNDTTTADLQAGDLGEQSQ